MTADDVFELCQEDFCAVERLDFERLPEGYPRPWINGGVMVVRPNQQRYGFLVNERLPRGYELHSFLDEAFLVEVMAEDNEALGTTKFLDWEYNSCSQAHFDLFDWW